MAKYDKYKNIVDDTIIDASNFIEKKRETVALDKSRPRYHFVSPAELLIDVWGGIFHKGEYHLFYDINCNADKNQPGGTFGHLRSKDMLEWENLPFALMPEMTNGENHLNDGTIVIDPSGKPLMYYTRCFDDLTKNREHVPVRGSDDLLVWERLEDESLTITMENHGGPTFLMSWSDPIIFSENGRTFMIISKCTVPNEGDMIPIYEATDDTWTKWEYRGVFADHMGEVVNFIKIRDKWVLIYSPWNNPKYFVGTFDTDSCKFICEREGMLSYGYLTQGEVVDYSRGFYATASFYGKDKTPYILGWISGFIDAKGWEGCVSLPRTLDIAPNGELLMNPAPILENLRGEKQPVSENSAKCGRMFELDAEFEKCRDNDIEIEIRNCFKLTIKGNKIIFNDIEFNYKTDKNVKIKMYVDVTLAEIFIDGGRASISRCFKEIKNENAALSTKGGTVKKFDVYAISELY